MAGIFTIGEAKVRPGTYFNIQNVGENALGGAVEGVTAVIFKADWGPLNQAVELDSQEGYEGVFGSEGTTDAIAQAYQGGAKTAVCCRIGSGGTPSKIVLKNEEEGDLVTIAGKYPGEKPFSLTLRTKLTDSTKKECIIYSGTKEFEKHEFIKGGDEVSELVSAFSDSKNFTVTKEGGNNVLEDEMQTPFTLGTNPSITNESYSKGFGTVEALYWNTICVDTENKDVHALLQSFVDRIYEVGKFPMAVIAEGAETDLETRMAQAASYNNEKVVYVLNASLETAAGNIKGYQTAARIAGMISAVPSNRSLTHTVLDNIVDINEKLTNTEIIKAETMGCLVLTASPAKQVWIDNAINTLITPDEGKDEGWKKIRRTKTRYELLTRANNQIDLLIGRVDNDSNGRATIVSQLQGIGTAMVEEGKLNACKVTESVQYPASGDSAWFDIDAIDKDSAEHVYLTFKFRFSTQV